MKNKTRKELYDLGCNDREIGEIHGISRQAVQMWRKKHSLGKQEGHSREVSNRINVYKDLKDKGYSENEIIGKMNISMNMLRILLKKEGIKNEKEIEDDKKLELYKKGLTDGEIGKKFDTSSGAIWAWRKRRGLPTLNPNVITQDIKERRLSLYRQGYTIKEIAKKEGRAEGTMYSWIRNNKQEQPSVELKLLNKRKFKDVYNEREYNKNTKSNTY